MARARAWLTLTAALVCAGCQYSPDMLDRTVAYNRTVANSTNQVLLLNIVRASQRLPTYYSRLEGDAASLGLTPNGSFSSPFSNGRSFENDLTTSAAGAVTSGGSKAITTLGNILGSFGLQASESNVMTLQTLDDQKYQNGMMTPVPVKNIQAFQDEGYQRDLLFLMFLSSIAVSDHLLGTLDDATAARCSEVMAGPGPGNSFVHQLCGYIASDPYAAMFDPGHAQKPGYSYSLQTCAATGSAVTEPAPLSMVRFNNDPAREGRRSAAQDPHPEICFQILLNDLLVLGLEVGSAQDVPAEVVDVVPDTTANDPKFRATMIQQNFFMRETSAGVTAICKKKGQDNGFTLTFTNPVRGAANARTQPPSTTAPLNALLNQLGVDAPARPGQQTMSADAATYPIDPAAACQQKNPGVPESAREALLATPTQGDALAQGSIKPVKLTSDKLAFSTRSFEGMIYYLGETVRYQQDPNADPANFARVLGRNPRLAGSGYVETMFYSSTKLPGSDTAVSVRAENGDLYAIPKSCMSQNFVSTPRQIGCSEEYPDNESVQVLNFVNQIWGLQKESVASPSSPLITITPP